VPDRVLWIRDALVHNWTLKLLAVLLGALSLYTIRGAISFEVPYQIPVEIKVEPGVAILDQSLRSVEVSFRGSQDDLRYLNQKHIHVVVRPNAKETSGSETIQIEPQDVEGAHRVRVVAIRPGEITVSFDHEAERQVAVVRPRILGRPLLGQLKVEYAPQVVRIRGPKRRLETIASVATEPLDVEGKIESFSTRLRVLTPPDTWVSLIEPSDITADVTILTETTSREFTNVAVVAMIPPGISRDIRLEPAAVKVTVHGRPEAVNSVVANTLLVFVACTSLEAGGSYELPVRVHLPDNLDASAAVEPKTVNVTLQSHP
jgi:hypothetical protein